MKLYKLSVASLMLICASCSDEPLVDTPLSEDGTLTPLEVSVSLNDVASLVQTRAVDKSFDTNDELLVYIQHMNGSAAIEADMAPALVTFKVTSNNMTSVDAITQQTSNLEVVSIYHTGSGSDLKKEGQTTLYWDDFSDSRNENTDLRTANHGLRPYYGFCFNGGTPTDFVQDAGYVDWKVADNQSEGIKTNDLLWSGTATDYVSYSHELDSNGKRLGLSIPYTHAMSKVTIALVAGDGFTESDLSAESLKVTLQNMYTKCGVTAPTPHIITDKTPESTKNVIMNKHNDVGSITVGSVTKPTKTFEAIVVPSKEWAVDNTIAVIEGMDGNTYNISATQSIINQFGTSGAKITDGKVIFESGKNYKLTITLDKQPQDIVAKITNWTDIEAEGKGVIQFAADVVSHNMDTENVQGSFDLWRSTAASPAHNSFDEDSDPDNGVNKATTVTYEGGAWKNIPEIYWADGSQDYYFRALAKFVQVEDQKQIISNEDISSFDVAQGTDIVWGTTSKHTGNYTDTDGSSKTKDYDEGAAIDPRTGTVPLTFKHAMSKISVNLATSTGADAVNLTNAKLSIANLYDGGTIDLSDGSVKDLKFIDQDNVVPISGFYDANYTGTGNILKEYVVIPQSLTMMADETERTGAVSFYNKNELLEIGGESYVISSLDPVPYGEGEMITTNADLVGSVNVGDKLNYTEAQFLQLKASEIPESLFEVFHFAENYEEFIRTETRPFSELTDEDYYTIKALIEAKSLKHNVVSARAYNSKLPGAIHPEDIKGYQKNSSSIQAKAGDLKPGGGTKIVMLIMLNDGTTYTLDMATCTPEGSSGTIDTWVPGKHYKYTITLKKEEVTFRAMIKEWDEKKTSGNATLEWD